MAQPPAYTRGTDFSDYAGNNPGDPMSGTSLDAEFDNIKTTIDAILTNLALVQRDDTELANDTVGADQVKSDLVLGINPAGAWLTATAYAVNDGVWEDDKLYVCQVAHTSGTFATDLAAVSWLEIVDVGAAVDAAVAADAALVTVAGIETEVVAVAAVAAAVSTVAGIDTETAAVAAIAAAVSTVASDSADIQTVAANIATIATKMNADFSNASGALTVDHGGTGSTDAASARTAFGLGSMAIQNATDVDVVDLTASGGFYLGGEAAANYLNDYEEGDFTPGFTFGGGSTGMTFSSRAGKYTKIGSLVFVQGVILLSAKGSSTGGAAVTGLPFAAEIETRADISLDLISSGLNASRLEIGIAAGATLGTVRLLNDTTGTMTGVTDPVFSNTSQILFNFSYRTAA